MAFIPIPNSATLCFDFTTAGQNWQFCFTIRKSAGAITPTDLAVLSGEGAGWWTSSLKPLLSSGNVLRQVRATDQQVEGGAVDIETVGTAGTAGTSLQSLGSPLVISLRTAKRGRSYRGRVYLSGLMASELLSEVDYQTASVAAFVAEFVEFKATLDGLGYDIVVPSKQHNLVETNPAEVNEVIAIVADTHIDSMRKRLFGRGT